MARAGPIAAITSIAASARTPTLGTRLALSVALSVATVISLVVMAGTFVAGKQLEADLRETARVTAVALADEIEHRSDSPTKEDLLPLLGNFMNAAANLNAISVFDAGPEPHLLVQTSEIVKVPLPIVRLAMDTRAPAWSTPLNLITNALDAMPAGGTLTIRATSADPEVSIEVTDTGTGIAPEILPYIFQPWVTTKSAGEGNGLGLSITRDVIARLGGGVAAHSEPGRGATFVITLPISRGVAESGSMPEPQN